MRSNVPRVDAILVTIINAMMVDAAAATLCSLALIARDYVAIGTDKAGHVAGDSTFAGPLLSQIVIHVHSKNLHTVPLRDAPSCTNPGPDHSLVLLSQAQSLIPH